MKNDTKTNNKNRYNYEEDFFEFDVCSGSRSDGIVRLETGSKAECRAGGC